MTSWKRIAALFVFSLSTAILGAACATKVDEPAPTAAEPEQDISVPPPIVADHGGERRERCQRHCIERFDDCMSHDRAREGGRERRSRCERERHDCFDWCDRGHE